MSRSVHRFLWAWLGLILVWGSGCADYAVKTPLGDVTLGQGREEQRQAREEAVARYNYCPTSGCVVRLESLQVRPDKAYRGENITLTTTYTILTPEQVAIPVTISRELFFGGKSLGKVQSTNTRNNNGTWSRAIDLALPANVAPGIYTIVSRISTGYGSDEKSIQFTVE